jgi:hypothetical protein
VLDPFIKLENEHLLVLTEDNEASEDGENLDDDAHARSILMENVKKKTTLKIKIIIISIKKG